MMLVKLHECIHEVFSVELSRTEPKDMGKIRKSRQKLHLQAVKCNQKKNDGQDTDMLSLNEVKEWDNSPYYPQ